MAHSPRWKIYRFGEYIGATKYAEDAAALVSLTHGSVVKYDHKVVVWIEDAEDFSAAESYDRAANVMRARRDGSGSLPPDHPGDRA
jgi:hypothetical protein